MNHRISLPLLNIPENIDQLPVCIISLKEANSRRNLLHKRGFSEELLSNYFPATDLRFSGHTLVQCYVDRDTSTQRYGRELRPAEVGCALSHMNAYKWLVSSPHHLMLILEDDVIPLSDNHLEEVKLICQALTPLIKNNVSFVCHLGIQESYFQSGYSRPVKFSPEQGHIPGLVLHNDKGRSVWLAHAYLISSPAAAKIIQFGKVKYLADDFLAFQKCGAIQRILISKAAIYKQDHALESTVQLKYKNKTTQRIKILRKFNAIYSRFVSYVTKNLPFLIKTTH